jgi:cobalt-precorrin-5B (C1)-methyltransferase
VEAVVESLGRTEEGTRLWLAVEERLETLVRPKVPQARHVHVRLFSMNGTPLGGAK